MSTNGNNTGTILEIKGVVLDVRFASDLPSIYNALQIFKMKSPSSRVIFE